MEIQVELLGGLVNRPVMSEPAILIMRVTLNLLENSVGLWVGYMVGYMVDYMVGYMTLNLRENSVGLWEQVLI